MAQELLHYFNGNYVPKDEIKLSIDDVGILRGYGVFEFMQAQGRIAVFAEEHIGRLMDSASAMNMTLPFGEDEFQSIIQAVLMKNQLEASSIKIIVTGGNTSDGFSPGYPTVIVLNMPLQLPPDDHYENGVSLMTYNYARDYPTVKSTYYAKALSLQKIWQKDNHIDVLYHDGTFVSEVSRSNVFFLKGGKLITNEEGILNGITRRSVIKTAKQFIEVELRPIKLSELYEAEEVFITSTTKMVMPVVRIDDQKIGNGKVGEQTREMMDAFRHHRQAYVENKLLS